MWRLDYDAVQRIEARFEAGLAVVARKLANGELTVVEMEEIAGVCGGMHLPEIFRTNGVFGIAEALAPLFVKALEGAENKEKEGLRQELDALRAHFPD